MGERFFQHLDLKIDFAPLKCGKAINLYFSLLRNIVCLYQFAHHLGQILTGEELLTAIWGPSYRDDKEILWVSIARLRQKLEENPHSPCHIITRSGLGYLMPAEVTAAAAKGKKE